MQIFNLLISKELGPTVVGLLACFFLESDYRVRILSYLMVDI